TLPGVSAARAKQIVAGRPYKSVRDLQAAGFTEETIAKIAPLADTSKISINTASAAELAQLPGVGHATAKKIVAGRPYKSVEDLKTAGVSDSEIAKIAPFVQVKGAKGAPPTLSAPPATPNPASTPKPGAAPDDGPTTEVDLNTATAEELEKLPGISE